MNPHRSRLALGLAASVATFMVVALAPANADPSPTSQVATQALQTAKDLFAGKLTPHAGAGARSSRKTSAVDASMIMRDLYEARPSLPQRQRAQANRILARPTDDPGDCVSGNPCRYFVRVNPLGPTYSTTHFLIHYDSATSYADAAATGAVLEQVWSAEVARMHFRQPLSDHSTTPTPSDLSNPDSRIDVYLADLRPAFIYGYCTPAAAPDGDYYQSSAYCVLDNDFVDYANTPANSRAVTAAHEFFHAIQFGYDYRAPRWFMEGSAVWMEDEVYNRINDYLQYVPASPIRNPMTPFTRNGSLSVYGDFTLFKFLEKKYDSQFVLKMWQKAATMPAMTALKRLLKSHHSSLAKAIPLFGRWNTLPPHSYPERLSYRPAGTWKLGYLKLGHHTKNYKVRIKPLATAPLVALVKGHKKARAVITAKAPRTGSIWVQIRLKNGKDKTKHFGLSRKGTSTHRYGFDARKTVAVVVTMTDATDRGGARPFRIKVAFTKR